MDRFSNLNKSASVAKEVLHRVLGEADQQNVALSFTYQSAKPGSLLLNDHANGDLSFYPASVVKFLYLVVAEELIASGARTMSPEIERALQDMIVESSNDATGLIVDWLTETTGGPELDLEDLSAWMTRRQLVNRWFAERGFEQLNACQKTWNEGPYGRERQGYGPSLELRNALSTNAVLNVCEAVWNGKLVSVSAGENIKQRLKRVDPMNTQFAEYLGAIAPASTCVYSKAGWTSEVRHDLAVFEFLNGERLFIAVFTKGCSEQKELVPRVGNELLKVLGIG